ncbi:MAG: MlaD family protein [Nitratireductor sp.]
METRANFVTAGVFCLGALMLGFAFIYWVATRDGNVNLFPLRVKIVGEVTGLAPGSAVHFNGIKVGKVEQLAFDPEDPRVVLAFASVKEDTPLRQDTVAVIAPAGLTGGAYIAMRGGTQSAQKLLSYDENGLAPLINARPSGLTDVLETVRDVADKAEATLSTVESLVNENRQSLSNTVNNVETFSKTLSDNADGVGKFLQSASKLGDSVNNLSVKLDGTIAGVESLVAAVDADKVKSTVNNIENFSKNLNASGAQFSTLMASVQQAATDLQSFSGNLDKSLKKFDVLVNAIEPEKVQTTINDIGEAAASAKTMIANANDITQSVAGRKEQIEQIISDASEMAKKLNASSDRIDSVLANLDGFLGSADGDGVMDEVRGTLAEFRGVANNLNTRINQVAGGITQFTNTGLSDVRALVNDSRRSISRIDRVISNLERDPSGFLFGKNGVKTFNGRPRR